MIQWSSTAWSVLPLNACSCVSLFFIPVFSAGSFYVHKIWLCNYHCGLSSYHHYILSGRCCHPDVDLLLISIRAPSLVPNLFWSVYIISDPTYSLAQKVPRGKTCHWRKGWRSPFCIGLGSWWACPSEIALCAPNPHEIATRRVLSLDAHSQLLNMPLSRKLHPIYFGTWTWN